MFITTQNSLLTFLTSYEFFKDNMLEVQRINKGFDLDLFYAYCGL